MPPSALRLQVHAIRHATNVRRRTALFPSQQQENPRGPGGLRRLPSVAPWRLLTSGDSPVTKLHTCLLVASVGAAVCSIGVFEAARLSTHVLRSPCTVVGEEVQDVGACTLCDSATPANCAVHPVATGRLAVTFRPFNARHNVTGWVWYCKDVAASDPCRTPVRLLDQLSFGLRGGAGPLGSVLRPQVPCTVTEVLAFTSRYFPGGESSVAHDCYYSSRDPGGEDVWLSMPSPGLVDHAWFQKHLGYPLLLCFGGLVLLSLLLGCIALEGVELWAAGLG